MLDARDDLVASNTWQPVGVLVFLVKLSLNWLPLSVRTFAVVLKAPQWRRHMIMEDRDFSDLFPARGPPAEAPVRLALATLLQFMEGLTDRQAAHAVRTRIDWKYLLCLELGDAGFDHTVLSEFRSRLLVHGAERRLFDAVLALAQARGVLKAGGRQRSD